MRYQKKLTVLFILSFLIAIVYSGCKDKNDASNTNWKAPADASEKQMPFENTAIAEQKGKELYNVYCWSCHGTSGHGDGAAGGALGQKPANLHERRVKNQSDGAIFWKISTGKGNMPPFKDVMTEEQRWQLVAYIRKLSDEEIIASPPRALRPDIKVEHFMGIGPLAVRILSNHSKLYYTSFDGNVFEITNKDSTQHELKKIVSQEDHGITRLQGAVFFNDTLFLCGNVDLIEKKATKGKLVRIVFDTAGKPQTTAVFNTVEYGANKTIYDHGWNALAVSPDGKFIFVNSGARTDHGEVQDNGGLYPKARDNALTAKIFRFPTNAKDIMLTDDVPKLKADGYLYAEGIRNAYDMAFDNAGNLFAVVNSADYDNPEDMFWVREGHHYGFPWIMGGIENPQQFPDWKPDPETDPFINKFSHSWKVSYFQNDPEFPKIPDTVKFSPGVQNWGPDANEYRGHTGKVLDGDQTGIAVSTFTAHSSPLGLIFDTEKKLAKGLQGDGFVIRYSYGKNAALMKPFTDEGSDLLHMHMRYDSTADNYFMKTVRMVDGFNEPTDAVLDGNILYVIEYGGRSGRIWKITLPADATNTIMTTKKLKK